MLHLFLCVSRKCFIFTNQWYGPNETIHAWIRSQIPILETRSTNLHKPIHICPMSKTFSSPIHISGKQSQAQYINALMIYSFLLPIFKWGRQKQISKHINWLVTKEKTRTSNIIIVYLTQYLNTQNIKSYWITNMTCICTTYIIRFGKNQI